MALCLRPSRACWSCALVAMLVIAGCAPGDSPTENTDPNPVAQQDAALPDRLDAGTSPGLDAGESTNPPGDDASTDLRGEDASTDLPGEDASTDLPGEDASTNLPGPDASTNPPEPDAGVAGGFVIVVPLELDRATVNAGETLTGTVTYQNTSSGPLTINRIVIAARPPGGTHLGGPFLDLEPAAGPVTVRAGARQVVTASRTFTASDLAGTWSSFATFQDASGWHDGPDVSFEVGRCVPTTCEAQGKDCDIIPDGCGGTLDCGECSGTEVCGRETPNVCAPCTPTPCEAQGKDCDTIPDGCGRTLSCGQCDDGETCGGGGTPNVCGAGAGELIPAARRTLWNPGIPGGIPAVTSIHTTLDAATYGNNSTDATNAINSALSAAAAVASASNRQVVFLPPGTYYVTDSIRMRSHVVLRGAGANQTRLRHRYSAQGNEYCVWYGNWPSYWPTARNVVANPATGQFPVKGDMSITVASVAGIRVGDMLALDKVDDGDIVLGGGTWWKREPSGENGPATPAGVYRSMGQMVEVEAIRGNTLELSGPLHTDFPASLSPQVYGNDLPAVEYAGLEDLALTGCNGSSIYGFWVKRSWVKGVEIDGMPYVNGQPRPGEDVGDTLTPGSRGCYFRMHRTSRFVFRDSYVHHSRSFDTNNNAYGLSLASQTSDSLIENNIVVSLNKNIVLEAAGGGNVIAYNYVDDPRISNSADWMEMGIDGSHLSGPYMALIEGNYTPKIGAAVTHGNALRNTHFRNWSTGVSIGVPRNSSTHTVQLDWGMWDMNVVGNVLAVPNPPAGSIYEPVGVPDYTWEDWIAPIHVYWLGGYDETQGGSESNYDRTVKQRLLRHGNFDYVTNSLRWDPNVPNHTLPDSLYLTEKPAFFGRLEWPWVDPTGATHAARIKVLPAKARFAAGTPFAPPPR